VPDTCVKNGSKLKIGTREAHDTGDPSPHLEVKRSTVKGSKVMVTGHINAVIENQPIFRKRKAYEFQTWYTDGIR